MSKQIISWNVFCMAMAEIFAVIVRQSPSSVCNWQYQPCNSEIFQFLSHKIHRERWHSIGTWKWFLNRKPRTPVVALRGRFIIVPASFQPETKRRNRVKFPPTRTKFGSLTWPPLQQDYVAVFSSFQPKSRRPTSTAQCRWFMTTSSISPPRKSSKPIREKSMKFGG